MRYSTLACALAYALTVGCSETAEAVKNFLPPTPDASTPPPVDGGDTGGPGDGDGWQGDGDGSQGDAATPPDAGEPEDPGPKPKCVQKDSQVIVIGDSYINWLSHTFTQDIVDVSGQNWRMQAIGGMSMATGGAGYPLGIFIPNQFDDAIAADPDAHTVLMDGGGNDVLVGWIANAEIEKCKDTGSSQLPVCQKVVTDALAAADALMGRMLTAGIRDVVYFFYPHIPEGRPIGGPHPNEMLDYALPQIRDFCDGIKGKTDGALRCHFIDMVPVFENHNPEWFNEDIHPNSEGSKAMAKVIWERMSAACIGQKVGASCCEP